MKEKTALVTGSTSGIGLAISDALAHNGYSVVMTGRRKTLLNDLVQKRKDEGLRVFGVPADLSLAPESDRLFEAGLGILNGCLDVLVNNAGAYVHRTVSEIDAPSFDALMALNLRAPFLLSKLAFPVMKRQSGGTIVNISSVAGLQAWAGTSLYSATKFGLRALTESLLAEGAPYGIKAFAICPGYVHTPMAGPSRVDAREMIQPEDIARIVLAHLSLSGAVVMKDVVVSRLGAEG